MPLDHYTTDDETRDLRDLEKTLDRAYELAARLRDSSGSPGPQQLGATLAKTLLGCSRSTAAVADHLTDDDAGDRSRGDLRDATGGELAGEPDAILQGLVDGSIETTPGTRQLAKQELDYRRLRCRG